MSLEARALTVAGALAGLVGIAPAASAAIWSSTATQAIPLVGATSLGALDPSTQMRITVALKMQNADALRSLIQAQNTPGSPAYRTVITPAQFSASYAPSSASVAAVRGYLVNAGLTNIAVTPNRLFITATGTAAQVAAAFNTQLTQFAQNGKTIFVNTQPAQVPASLGGIVLSLLGLNNVEAVTHPKAVTPCDVNVATCLRFTYDPATYWKAYDVGSVPAASGTSIAVMAEGDVSSVVTDLRTFETATGLPTVPVSIVPVGPASTDTSGVDEWDLDTQYTTGMAGTAKTLYIYDTTSLTDQDTTLEFNAWVTQNVAPVANASFSICEAFPALDGSMAAEDQVFMQGAAQGQTLFSSTGDTGSFCSVGTPNGVPAGAPFVGYPASSPYVVGVGGTTLLTNADGSYNGEVAWYAGGGGISAFEASPAWQAGITPTSAAGIRALPDVSMDADPNTGAIVYVGGQQTIVGGTSLSSPLAVGAWARLQNSHANGLGFASPKFYAGYPALGTPPSAPGGLTEAADGFNDVLTGANGLYTSLPYYDYTTGLGTIDVSKKNALVGN